MNRFAGSFDRRWRSRFGLQAGAFSPLSLSPLAWWDAQQETLSNGDALATVKDFSGNTRDLTQGTGANRGVFSTTGINGLPALQFDGVNDSLKRADVCGYTLNGPLAIWVVGKIRGSTSARTPFISFGQSGSGANYLTFEANTYGSTGSKLGLYVPGGNTYDSNQATSSSAFAAIICISDASSGQGVVATTTYKIGGVTKTLTALSGANWGSMTGMAGTALGSFVGGGVFGNVGIGEAGIVNRALTGAEVTDLTTYLASKWGV